MRLTVNQTLRRFMTKLAVLLRTCFFVTLVICCTRSNARSQQQKVTINAEAKTLSAIFKEIKRQTGLVVFYSDALINDKEKISLNVKEEMLSTLLDRIIAGRPLRYEIQEKYIVISAKPAQPEKKSEQLAAGLTAAPPTVHGRVTNEKGEPVAGVSISIKGGKTIGVTNDNGEFTLTNVADNAVLVFSAVNTETLEIKLNGRTELAFSLKAKTSVLDEVQMIAYGSTSKRLQTGNVTTVKGEDIAKQPVSNPLLALEGRVPGLFITQANGLPGSGVTVRIQGQNSIGSGNDPLYIVDGVPYFSQMPSTVGQIGGNLGGSGAPAALSPGNGNPLNYINPSDIESIEVLKDADATAIYGSRAASGAILITTKKGKSGITKLDMNLQEGWGQVTRKIDMLNTQQYLAMRREAFKNDNLPFPSIAVTPTNTDYDVNGLWDTTRYTNWQKELIGGTAQYTNLNASLSGGNAITQYLIGSTYHRETSVFPGSFSDQKGAVHFTISSASANQKFHLQFSGNYILDNNQLPVTDLTLKSLQLAPDAPPLYNADGSFNWAPNAAGTTTWPSSTHPLASLLNTYQNKTSGLISNLVLGYTILLGLEIKSSFGYNSLTVSEKTLNPLTSLPPEQQATGTRAAQYANSTTSSWIIEPQISYKKIIAKGKAEILAGATLQQVNADGQYIYGSGYSSDALLSDIKSATTTFILGTLNSVYKYSAVFGRLNYNWQDKYILNITARRDGSSRFGQENQYQNFGAIGAAWIFSQESFSKQILPFLSFGKLRGSYGTTGNDQIPNYKFLSLYSAGSVSVPYQNVQGLGVNSLTNPYLQWESTKKLQIGIDLGFIHDRLLLTANFVRNRSSNQLLGYTLPSITGFTSITSNFPATVQNTAWEFSVNSTNIKSNHFSWSTNLNLTIPKNKVVDFPNLSTSSYANSLVIGQPISITKVFHFLNSDPLSGVYYVADKNGNPTLTPNATTDKTVILNFLPRFYGGFQNTFRYKGLQLDVLFQFVRQMAPNVYYISTTPGAFGSNQPLTVLNRWQKPGDAIILRAYTTKASLNPALNSSWNNFLNSDGNYSYDASFVRLKNISLSYELPNKWIKKTGMQYCNVFLLGQNLLTITKYAGLDPENQNTSSLPPLRIVTAGVKIGL